MGKRAFVESRSSHAMTILTVRHVTTYRYRRPVALGDHRMMFRPRDSYDQRLIESRLVITPEPVRVHWIHDPFGNCVAVARFKGCASELRSRVRSAWTITLTMSRIFKPLPEQWCIHSSTTPKRCRI